MEAPACPNYVQIHEAALRLGQQLRDFVIVDNTRIIGIARGGLFLANILSHQLDIPVSIITYSSNKGKGESTTRRDNVKLFPSFDEDRLIIVDDICDSGYTLAEVHDKYANWFLKCHEVRTVVFYAKEDNFFEPSLTWYTIPADFPWVEFPWEDTRIV